MSISGIAKALIRQYAPDAIEKTEQHMPVAETMPRHFLPLSFYQTLAKLQHEFK
jgi:hypothetical protein